MNDEAGATREDLGKPGRELDARLGRPPEQLGDFRILREVGRGGMGVVYEAEQASLGRRVALKVLPPHTLHGPQQVERFQREARAAARLHHTNIVPIFGVGEIDGLHYYIMQFITGRGLDEVLADLRQPAAAGNGAAATLSKPATPPRVAADPTMPYEALVECLAPTDADVSTAQVLPKAPSAILTRPGETSYFHDVAEVGFQVADALQHAHALGILHRDIKPANLLVDERGTVWVTDFGLAKLVEQGDLTQPGEFGGTLRYTPPERFNRQSDGRGDIYSLGLTLYEMLALRPAFEESDQTRLMRQVMHDEPPHPRQFNAAIPLDLETIVLKAIARDPDHRYQTAGELSEDLRRFLEDRPIQARRVGYAERFHRWCRRNPAIASLGATATALLVLVAVVATAGYVRTREALDREAGERTKANAALRGESEQKARAEANLKLALEAFDAVFRQVVPRDPTLPFEQAVAEEPQEMVARPMVSSDTTAVLQKLLQFYDRFAEQNNDNATLQREAAKANWRVGDLQQRLHRYTEAERAYQRAIALYEKLDRDFPDEPEPHRELAVLHAETGLLRQLSGRPGEARADYLRAIELLQEAPEGPDVRSARERFELARVYLLLANLTWRGQKRQEAEEYTRQAATLLEKLATEEPSNPIYQQSLARTNLMLSMLLDPRTKLQDAHSLRGKAITILEKLAEDHPNVPGYSKDLADTYVFVGPTLRPEIAEQRLRKGVELSRELADRHPNVLEFQTGMAQALTRLATSQVQRGETAEAEKTFREALALLKPPLESRSPSPAVRLRAGEVLQGLGEVLCSDKRVAEARPLLEQSILQLELVQKGRPLTPTNRKLLAERYDLLAVALREQGETAKADDAAKRATLLRAEPDRRTSPKR